jgi:hypothetical protein
MHPSAPLGHRCLPPGLVYRCCEKYSQLGLLGKQGIPRGAERTAWLGRGGGSLVQPPLRLPSGCRALPDVSKQLCGWPAGLARCAGHSHRHAGGTWTNGSSALGPARHEVMFRIRVAHCRARGVERQAGFRTKNRATGRGAPRFSAARAATQWQYSRLVRANGVTGTLGIRRIGEGKCGRKCVPL